MAVINHPDAPYHDADGNDVWPECQCDCNECFNRDDAVHPGCKYRCGHPDENTRLMEELGDNRSISRGYGGCATCDGGGCRDCR